MSVMFNYYSCFAFVAAGAIAFALFKHHNTKRSNFKLPPSLPCDPIIGHMRLIPRTYSWETFFTWRRTIGDIIYVHILGRSMIILNSPRVVRDLLDKKGANFSDRPQMTVLNDMMGLGLAVGFLPYGGRWRRQRRLVQRYFDPQTVQMFRPAQEMRVHILLAELMTAPSNFVRVVQRMMSSSILEITYGHKVGSGFDPLLEKFKKVGALIAEVADAGVSIIDVCPPLRYLPTWLPTCVPGVSIKRHALRTRALIEEVMSTPLENLRDKKAKGIEDECFLSKVLDEYKAIEAHVPETEEEIKALGVLLFSAGYDTTTNTILTFFLMMALHPEVVKRAQDEIDAVTNVDRLPTLDDRSQLPFIDCIVKETYRINPAGPLGLPHQSMHEDNYGEWTIPRGSLVLANVWGMMNDPNTFANPRSFCPERFLEHLKPRSETQNGHRDHSTNIDASRDFDPFEVVYGFGRRICPGRYFAEATIWLTVANVLAVFDFGSYVDSATGQSIIPERLFTSGLTSAPKDFKCSILARSEKHAQLLRQDSQVG